MPEYILELLKLLKEISPNMEQFTIVIRHNVQSYFEQLDCYWKINILVNIIKTRYTQTFDPPLRIEIKVELSNRLQQLLNTKEVETHFKKYPDYKVEELPLSNRFSKFIASKQAVFSETFSLNFQIEMGNHYNDLWS